MMFHYRWSYYLKRPDMFFKELFVYRTKYFFLKLKHGFDVRDTWALDYSCAKWVLPRLKMYKEVCASWPSIPDDPNADTYEHWLLTLDRIIWAFQDLINEENNWSKWHAKFEDNGQFNVEKWRANHTLREEGFALFGKYFQCLWW